MNWNTILEVFDRFKKFKNKKSIFKEDFGKLSYLKERFFENREIEEKNLTQLLFFFTGSFNFINNFSRSVFISPINLDFDKPELELLSKVGVFKEVKELQKIDSQRIEFYKNFKKENLLSYGFINGEEVTTISFPVNYYKIFLNEFKNIIIDKNKINICRKFPSFAHNLISLKKFNSDDYDELEKGNINIILKCSLENTDKELTILEIGQLLFKIHLMLYDEIKLRNLFYKHRLIFFMVYDILKFSLPLDNSASNRKNIFKLYDKIIREIEIGIKYSEK